MRRNSGGSAFVFRSGVHVVGTALYCDTLRANDLCFLSSAEVLEQATTRERDGGPKRRRRGAIRDGTVLCSERTWRLYEALRPADSPSPIAPTSLLLSPCGRPFSWGRLRLELFPSGALPGAASLWLKLPSGRPLVYAGALNPYGGDAANADEAMQVRPADTLVCTAPLAACDRALPTLADTALALRRAVAEAADGDAVTVLLCPPTTGPQLVEILSALPKIKLYGHPRMLRALLGFYALSKRGSTVSQPVSLRQFQRPLRAGSVLLWPMGEALPPQNRLGADSARAVHTILCTGSALLPDSLTVCHRLLMTSGLTLTQALPFPDAIDRAALISYIADCGARTVYLTAGFSESLRLELRRRKVTLEPLGPPSQLALFAEPPLPSEDQPTAT